MYDQGMELVHYSKTKLTLSSLEDRQQTMGPYQFKPIGLWVSVKGKDDWREWCKSEDFGDIDSQHEHTVSLSENANILYLKSESDIRKFTKEFRCGVQHVESYPLWSLVAFLYDGLIIAPYVWSCRLDSDVRWYCSWDCASGCIWNVKAAVKEFDT